MSADSAVLTGSHISSVQPAIDVHDLGMKGSTVVFANVSATVQDGGMLVITGPEGSGKTALLLGLAGRMRLSEGWGTMCGVNLRRSPSKIRRVVSIGHVAGLTDLDDNLTVSELVAERLIMIQPWYKPWASRKRVDEVLERLGTIYREIQGIYAQMGHTPGSSQSLRADSFPSHSYIDELSDLEQFLLSVALAGLSRRPIIALDNIDLLRRREDRACAWIAVLMTRRIIQSPQVGTPAFIITCETHTELDEVLADPGALARANIPDPADRIVHLGLHPRE